MEVKKQFMDAELLELRRDMLAVADSVLPRLLKVRASKLAEGGDPSEPLAVQAIFGQRSEVAEQEQIEALEWAFRERGEVVQIKAKRSPKA